MGDAELRAELESMNGTPPSLLANEEFMQLVLPLFREDMEVCETHVYAPEEPLDVPISAFGGRADPLVDEAELRGWEAHTSGAFRLRTYPGDHWYLVAEREPLLAAIAADLG